MSRRKSLALSVAAVSLLMIGVALWCWNTSVTTAPKLMFPTAAREPAVQDSKPLPGAYAAIPISRQTNVESGKFGGLIKLSAAPIEFYGKVIDQDNKPLGGVQVIGGTGSKIGFMQDETRSYTTTTDDDGLFAFHGFKGDALIIALAKAGYNSESNRRSFLYSQIDPEMKRHVPDRGSPIVFQMWRKLGAERLIHYYARFVQIGNDGSPVRVDLARGVKVESGGDLLISTKWGPREGPDDMTFDWSVRLDAVEGGLFEGGSDVRSLDPSEGYKPTLEFSFAEDRKGHFEKTLYITSQNGRRYARAQMSFQRGNAESMLRVGLRVWLNPNGSRNLEYDSTLRVLVP